MCAMFDILCPCHFGLEAVLKREIYDLGYDISEVTDGRVYFKGDAEAVCRANLYLRTAERVLLVLGRFTAESFDELYENTAQIPFEEYIPKDGCFVVKKASSIKSRLISPPRIQSNVEAALVSRLKKTYPVERFEKSGAPYPIRVFIKGDEATIALDCTGASLHKRGYRTMAGEAPLSETLAAALILLSPWHGDRILVDPFCGSGTIPIEAAMMAKNIPPGLNRSFLSEKWENLIPAALWRELRAEGEEQIIQDAGTDIQGYDIDGAVLRTARENAQRAGVEGLIHFQQRDVAELRHPKKYGFIITNPPYGERLSEKEALPELYSTLGRAFAGLDSWSLLAITSFGECEKYIGRRADKKRKIYNGMLKTCYYQFLGQKPPKRKRE